MTKRRMAATPDTEDGSDTRQQSQLYKQQVTGHLIPCTTQWPSGGWRRHQTTVPALQTTSDGTLDTLHYTMNKRRMVAIPDNSPSSTNNKWRDTWYLALHNDQTEDDGETRQQSQLYKQQVTGHLIPCTTQWPSGGWQRHQTTVPALQTTSNGTLDTLHYTMTKRRMAATPDNSPSSTNNKWRDTWYLALHNEKAEDGSDTRQQSQLYKQQVTGHLIPCTTQWPSGGWQRHQTTVPALQSTSDGTLDTLHYTIGKWRMAVTPDNSPSSTNNKWRDTWYLALHNDQAEDGSDTRQQSQLYKQQVTGHLIPCTTMIKRRMAATPDNSPSSTNNKWRDIWYLALHNDQAEDGSNTRQQSQLYKQKVTGHLIPCTTQLGSGGWRRHPTTVPALQTTSDGTLDTLHYTMTKRRMAATPDNSPSSTNNKWRDTWYLALHNDQAEDGSDTRQQSQLYKQQVKGHLIPCTTQWPSGGWRRHQTTVPALQTTSEGTLDTLHYTMTKRRMAATPNNSPSSTNNKWRDTWYLDLHNWEAEDGGDTRQQSQLYKQQVTGHLIPCTTQRPSK